MMVKPVPLRLGFMMKPTKSLDTITILNTYGDQLSAMLPGSSILFVEIESFDPTNIDYMDNNAIIHLKTLDDQLTVDLYKSELETIHESLVLQALSQYRINIWAVDKTEAELALIEDFLAPLDYEVFYEGEDNTTRDMILSVLSMLIAIPIFIMLIMSVQFVGVDIIEEKNQPKQLSM